MKLCYLLLILCTAFISCFCGKENQSCSHVHSLFQSKSSTHFVLQESKDALKVACAHHGSPTCCTKEMEEQLKKKRVEKVVKEVKTHNAELRSAFTKMHKKFDDYFLQLIETARDSFDDLFSRTYGSLYTKNSDIFMELFEDLTDYYKNATFDLHDRFDTFFTSVMQRVFELIYSRYLFTDAYHQCIADHMNTLQPFDLLPVTISSQVQRAFAIAHTLVRELEVGKTLSAVNKFMPTPHCERALLRMSVCPLCRGTTTHPCRGLCVNVIGGCLLDHNHVDKGWKNYLDALRKLLYRLQGPFNMEAVLDPFDVKLSEAVMMLQDNKDDISEAVFRVCGTPKVNPNASFVFPPNLQTIHDPHASPSSVDSFPELTDSDKSIDLFRGKRSAKSGRNKKKQRNSMKRKGRHLDRSGKNKKVTVVDERRYEYSKELTDTDVPTHYVTMTSLIKELREVMKDYRHHWTGLPHILCDDKPEDSATCWNGTSVARYHHHVIGRGMERDNPEVSIDGHVISDLVRAELVGLKKSAERLMIAYQGRSAFQLEDEESDGFRFSGDGSAEGSSTRIEDVSTEEPTTTKLAKFAKPSSECPGCGGATSVRSFNFLFVFSFVLIFVLS